MIRNMLDHPVNLLIVVLVIVVVVGWKRLPDVARSLGRSARILKSEVDEMKEEGKSKSAASSDTVKGETVKPNPEATPSQATSETAHDPIQDPTKKPAAERPDREMHNQPPV
jgi:sec-independent protein translocase protein TatA